MTKLTDSSLIVTWMTSQAGLLKTVARGARRPKSPFMGRLDLFVSANFQIARSRKSELHVLRELEVVDYREDLRKSYRVTMTASYFSQLLDLVLESEHPEPEIFDLLQRALRYLGSEEVTLRGLYHFEKQVALFLGLGNGGHLAIERNYGKLPEGRKPCLDFLK